MLQKMRQFVLSLATFTALTGLAQAADLAAPAAPAPVVETVNWTGPYGGVQIGGTFGQSAISVSGIGLNTTIDPSGVLGGGFGGYNVQIQNFVLGGEAEFNLLSNKQSSTPIVNGVFYNTSTYGNWDASVNGRIGYAWKNLLVYAIGGYAFSDTGTTINANGRQIFGNTQTVNGYDVGGGFETIFAPNWSARLEYRYYDYQNVTNYIFNTTKLVSQSQNASTVRAGVAYHWFPAPAPVAAVAVKY
jgi:outer membrane immunogenic protein